MSVNININGQSIPIPDDLYMKYFIVSKASSTWVDKNDMNFIQSTSDPKKLFEFIIRLCVKAPINITEYTENDIRSLIMFIDMYISKPKEMFYEILQKFNEAPTIPKFIQGLFVCYKREELPQDYKISIVDAYCKSVGIEYYLGELNNHKLDGIFCDLMYDMVIEINKKTETSQELESFDVTRLILISKLIDTISESSV